MAKNPEFPYKKKGDYLTADHVNDLSEGVRMALSGEIGKRPPFHLRVYEVTQVFDAVVVGVNEAKYLARPRYWDAGTNAWALDSEANEVWLDASDFGDNLLVGDKVAAYYDQNRGALIPLNGTTSTGSGGGDTGGGGVCCCNEGACLPKIDGLDNYYPLYYSIFLRNFICGCAGLNPTGEVRLYPNPPNQTVIWESTDEIFCLGASNQSVPCTNEANWIWGIPTCSGTCHYVVIQTFPGPVLTWQLTGTNPECSPTGCGCLDPNDINFTGGTPSFVGQTHTQGCTDPSGVPGWNLVGSYSNPACDCVPDEPSYSGTEIGQTAITSCNGTQIVDGSSQLYSGKWRLTIGSTSYGGCDSTKLEFILNTGE